MILFGSNSLAVLMTLCKKGCPTNSCITFGFEDFIRVPLPAASITISKFIIMLSINKKSSQKLLFIFKNFYFFFRKR